MQSIAAALATACNNDPTQCFQAQRTAYTAAAASPSLHTTLAPTMHTSSSAFLGTSFSMTVDVVIVCAAVIVLVFVLCACYCLCCSSSRKRRAPPRPRNRPPPAEIVTYQPHYELTPYRPQQQIQAPTQPQMQCQAPPQAKPQIQYQAPPQAQPISFVQQPPQPQFVPINPDAPAITPIPASGALSPPIATKPAVPTAMRAQPYTGVPYAYAKRGFAYDENVRDENEDDDEVGSAPLSEFGVPLAMHDRRDQHGEEQRRTLANWTRDSN